MLTYSESLTDTTLDFWLASIVRSMARSDCATNALIPLTVAASLIALTRPHLLIFVLPTHLVILIWRWRKYWRPLPAIGSAPAILPFRAFAVYRVYFVPEFILFEMRYALNNLVGKNDSFRDYALSEMPPCDLGPAALNDPAPWNDTRELGDSMINACPETWLWFRSYAAHMPQWMFARPTQTVVLSIAPQSTALPAFVSQMILNPESPLIWILGYLIAGIIFAIISEHDQRSHLSQF